MKRFILLVLLLLSVGSLNAQTATFISPNIVRVTWPTSYGTAAYVAIRFEEDFPNGPTQATPVYGSATTGGTYDYTLPSGKKVYVSYFCNPHWNSYSAIGPIGAAPPTYGVTFPIPANTTTRAITYMVLRGGVSIASYTQPSGGAAASLYVGGLSSPTPQPILVQVTGGFVSNIGGLIGIVPEGNSSGNPPTQYVPVNNGVAPSAETSPGSGATATAPSTTAPVSTVPGANTTTPTTVPTAPTPTAPPSAPTTTTPVSAPSHPTPPTPTGTDPTKKEDTMAAANQVTTAITNASTQATTNANAIIAATDKVAAAVSSNSIKTIEAVDKTTSAVWDSGKKVIETLNKTNSALDDLNTKLSANTTSLTGVKTAVDAVGTKLDTTNTRLSEIKTAIQNGPDRTADTTAANSAYATAQAQGASARTSAEGSVSAYATPTVAPVAPGSQSFQIVVPGITTFDLDPASDPTVSALISWMRGLMAWGISLSFIWWAWGEFRQLMLTAVMLPQAKGNPVVGGTGGQITALVAAAAISVILLALPASFFALSSFGSGIAQNPFASPTTPVSKALYLFYLFFPVDVIVAAITAAFVVRKGGVVILTGVAAAVRFIIP